MVPRIGQVRRASRRSNAACTSAWVNPGSRTPSDHMPLARSCACMAPNHSTTSATVVGAAVGWGRSSRLVIRSARASEPLSAIVPGGATTSAAFHSVVDGSIGVGTDNTTCPVAERLP